MGRVGWGLMLAAIALLLGAACGGSGAGGSGADCNVLVRFDGRTYVLVGDVATNGSPRRLGDAEMPECDDSAHPDEGEGPPRGAYFSGQGPRASLVRLPGVRPAQAIGSLHPSGRASIYVRLSLTELERKRLVARILG